MSLAPVPSEQGGASCANCSAPLAPDQRYCLACGQPASPVRLAFLDVLQADAQPYGAGQSPAGSLSPAYAPMIEPASGAYAWMRRYSGLFGLLSVLLLAIVVGLLVGHWVTQSKAPAQQVLKVEGLSAAPVTAAANTTPASTTPTTAASTTPSTTTKSRAKAEAEEVTKEAKAEKEQAAKVEKAKTVKPSSTKLKKLGSSTGQKHEEEVNSLGAQPIETGGG
jgi:hypothetical protein